MSLEDQIPDVESCESDNEVQQNQNPADPEEDPNSLFNNLTSFQGIYTNNQIIDNEHANEAAERQVTYNLVSEVLELFLETATPEEELSSGSEDDDILQELSGLIDDLFDEMFSSSSSSENTEAEDRSAEARVRSRALRTAEEDVAAERASVAPVATNEGEQNNSEQTQNQQQAEEKK